MWIKKITQFKENKRQVIERWELNNAERALMHSFFFRGKNPPDRREKQNQGGEPNKWNEQCWYFPVATLSIHQSWLQEHIV